MRPSGGVATVGGRTFASLRNHRDYRLYFAGNGVSFIVAGTIALLVAVAGAASVGVSSRPPRPAPR